MPKWFNREDLVSQAVSLHRQQTSNRAIARSLGISRNTVKSILDEHAEARVEEHLALPKPTDRAPRPSKLDDYRKTVTMLLESYPDITAQRVLEELRKKDFDGGYSIVKELVRKMRPKPPATPSLPTEDTGPGEMAECDWSPHRIDFTNGERAVVHVFSYVLRYSTRKFFGLFEREDMHALMDGHVHAFERFGGAAQVTKYDSQKAVVLGWEGNQPIYNPRFLTFTTYYEYRPQACRRFHPNDKPRTERSFWEFERSFLNGRRFFDLDDMRVQLDEWMESTCDPRPHRKLKRPRMEMFEEETPHLMPLPDHPYDTARVLYRLADIEGFVAWDGNRYAVPYDHVTEILPLRITQNELFVYAADLKRIARHELAPKSAGLDLDPARFHRAWKNRPAASLDQLEETFTQMGEAAQVYFRSLLEADRRQCGHHARQLLLLRRRYSTDDLVEALAHAHEYGAFSHKAVARILAARARPRTLAEHVAEQSAHRLDDDDRDAHFIEPDDLDEYDRLPVVAPPDSTRPETRPCPNDDLPTTPTSCSNDSDDISKSSD